MLSATLDERVSVTYPRKIHPFAGFCKAFSNQRKIHSQNADSLSKKRKWSWKEACGMKPKIGVLLTSTCYSTSYFEKVDPKIVPDMFKSRVEELVKSISKLSDYIHQPFELIIADNSPAYCIPTEQIIRFRPKNTLFIRSTENPGKQIGEIELIRDGVHLSFARGHRWLLKLTGRYHITGNWSFDNTIKMLEEREKQLHICLYGAPMQDSYHTTLHPLYSENPGDDRILAGVVLAMFICNPEYLVTHRVFQKEYLYKKHFFMRKSGL